MVGGRALRGRSSSRPSGNSGSTTASPHAQLYDMTLYVMAGLLFVGFICNALVRPVDFKTLDDE